jgi:hypothetical protein
MGKATRLVRSRTVTGDGEGLMSHAGLVWLGEVADRSGLTAGLSEVLAGAPLDDGNVDTRQRQLARQHQPCRTSSGDHHRMLGHRHTPVGAASPTIGSTSRRDPYVVNNNRIS